MNRTQQTQHNSSRGCTIVHQNVEKYESISPSTQQKKQNTCNICKVDLVKLQSTYIMNEQLKWRPVGLLNADLDLARQHS